MAREGRIVRQLPVGLWAEHDRYLRRQEVIGMCSQAEIMREALDRAMAAQGHTCVDGDAEDECEGCGGGRGQV